MTIDEQGHASHAPASQQHVAPLLQCQFNIEAGYLHDAELVEKLSSLPDFPALKAFLVEVLEPPSRPAKQQGGQPTPNKRKVRHLCRLQPAGKPAHCRELHH